MERPYVGVPQEQIGQAKHGVLVLAHQRFPAGGIALARLLDEGGLAHRPASRAFIPMRIPRSGGVGSLLPEQSWTKYGSKMACTPIEFVEPAVSGSDKSRF